MLEQADSCLMIQNQQGFVLSHHTAEEFHREMEGTSHSWDFLPKVKKKKKKEVIEQASSSEVLLRKL